jgi:hypothetical protein
MFGVQDGTGVHYWTLKLVAQSLHQMGPSLTASQAVRLPGFGDVSRLGGSWYDYERLKTICIIHAPCALARNFAVQAMMICSGGQIYYHYS